MKIKYPLPQVHRRTRLRAVIGAACAALTLVSATAAWPQSRRGVFVDALIDGSSTQPLPDAPVFRRAVQSIQERTHDSGPLTIRAIRLLRFASQQRCGRIAFLIAQPSSGHVFPQLGGELNICEDGMPPLRECAERAGVLVPTTAKCKGGEAPRETAEVNSAIPASAARGAATPPPSTGSALQ